MLNSAIKISYKQLILIFMISILACCGKKGPLIPPQVQPVLIKDLSAEIKNNQVTLTWTTPIDIEQADLSRFTLYESKTPVSKTECNKCPLVFKPIAHNLIISSQTSDNSQKIKCHIPVQKGFRYVYKVDSSNENRFIESNYVRFVH